jgi:hypothetical protein
MGCRTRDNKPIITHHEALYQEEGVVLMPYGIDAGKGVPRETILSCPIQANKQDGLNICNKTPLDLF